jgi:hypothetical protein
MNLADPVGHLLKAAEQSAAFLLCHVGSRFIGGNVMSTVLRSFAVLVLASAAQLASAAGITDPAGDLLSTFTGSTARGDLDVLSATVTYDAATDQFRLTGTMNGLIGSQPNELYVWGVNRGAGTAGFAANGITGVRFDRVVTLTLGAGGSFAGAVGGVGSLAANSVTTSGTTISVVVPGTFLVSTGFNKLDYTWNLWPRDSSQSGFAAIADFAPDNANFTSTPGTVAPVPLPDTLGLLGLGLGLFFLVSRKNALRFMPRLSF